MSAGPDYIAADLHYLAVPIKSLRPYARNPRRGNLQFIIDSLRHHGQYKPILARSGTNEVLAGNHTMAAAKELGWEHIAVQHIDVTHDQAARIVLADNRTSDLGTYDDEQLLQLLDVLSQEDDGLTGTGYTDEDLDRLADLLNDDDLDEPDKEPDDGWMTLQVKVPEVLGNRFNNALDSYDGDSEAHRLKQLLDAHPNHRINS